MSAGRAPGIRFPHEAHPLAHRLTQQQVADLLHIERSCYSYYELGKVRMPLELLVLLARFYHISVDELLGLPEEDASQENGPCGETRNPA